MQDKMEIRTGICNKEKTSQICHGIRRCQSQSHLGLTRPRPKLGLTRPSDLPFKACEHGRMCVKSLRTIGRMPLKSLALVVVSRLLDRSSDCLRSLGTAALL